MAADRNSNRQPSNMGCAPFDVYSKSGSRAAELRSATGLVDEREEFALQLRIIRVFIANVRRTKKSALGKIRSLIHGTANTYADNHRRAGIAAGMQDDIKNSLLDTLNAICRNQHLDAGLVLTAEALRCQLDLELVALYHLGIDDSRRIILCILTIE